MSLEELEKLVKQAEHCHTQMYDCAPHNLKDFKDDALLYFSRAKSLALQLGKKESVEHIEREYEKIQLSYRQLRT